MLALIAIMLFFQFTTGGTLFKPVNLTNLVQQNSFIIVMALGMLLVIVAGHIDLSVGSVAGLHRRARRHDDGDLAARAFVSNPLVVAIVCLVVGGAIGAAQGYWIAYHRIPSFIVTLAGMLVFRGLCLALLGGGSSVGPLPDDFQALSSGFIPDVIGALTLVPPTLNAAGKTIIGSGLVLHTTTIVIGIIGVVAYVVFRPARRAAPASGTAMRPSRSRCSSSRRWSSRRWSCSSSIQFATYKGLPNVLIVMARPDRRSSSSSPRGRPSAAASTPWAATSRRRSFRASRPSG